MTRYFKNLMAVICAVICAVVCAVGSLSLASLFTLFILSGSATLAPAYAEEVTNPALTALNNANNNKTLPFTVERFVLAGPVTGVVVKVNLADPRVKVEVALANSRRATTATTDASNIVSQLDTTSSVAKKFDFDIAINASYFAAPVAKEFNGKKIQYFVGNGAYPVGWHFSNGTLVTSPVNDKLRATMIVHEDGSIILADHIKKLPADTQFAVSGNAMMLTNNHITPPENDVARNPRSAVGLSENGKTLVLIVVDGRSDKSRGVTLGELAKIFQQYGAANAINLDGGGSSTMVVKDPGTGVYSIANQPSDLSTLALPIAIERPVVDVIGIKIR